jgi:hypothetical protein
MSKNIEMSRTILETVASICLSNAVVDTLYNEVRGGPSMDTLVEELMGHFVLSEAQQTQYEACLGGGSKEDWESFINSVVFDVAGE